MYSIELSVITKVNKNRLDRFLASEIKELSRNKIKMLISKGGISVNSVSVNSADYNLKYRDTILVNCSFEMEKSNLISDSSIKFSILYEDKDLLVINKPSGVVVHPGHGNHSHTLVNGLIHHCGESLSKGSEESRPGIVHRIDKDTSGILVIAKNDFSHYELSKQFASHSIKRKYVCFCYSTICPPIGKIETFISRDKNNRLKMAVSADAGKLAMTLYKTIKAFSKFASKVECELKTGRTHQIRVHLSHLGCSLIGDSIYRIKNYSIPKNISAYVNHFPRQALHACFLEFYHPNSKKIMRFKSDMPDDMQELENVLDDCTIKDYYNEHL